MEATPPRPSDHLATISVGLGIVALISSVVCCCIPLNWFFSVPLSISAVATGALALRRMEEGEASVTLRKHALGGIVTGIIGLIVVAIIGTMYFTGLASGANLPMG